ncbi:DNA topoisomerase (plasmid) [Finegoldia magna]|uniref:DNA topoisomerase n=1 Tax=Finegoldia magna TaxID=1260 RepID=UPI00370DAEAC
MQEGFNKIQYNKLDYSDELDLSKGQSFQCDLEIKKTKTKPKPRFTDATIVSSMENLKDIDERYKGGIGTPATRDSIIEKLVEYKYLERSKKTLKSTSIARVLYKLLSKQIKTVELTAALEEKLEEVRLGKIEQTKFLSFIEKYIENEIERVKNLDDLRIEVCDCPFCGKKVLNQGLKYACEDENCSFEIWKKNKFFESFGIKEKTITDEFISQLCSESGVMIKGLKSKKGEKYSAIFRVNEDDNKTNISVDFPKKKYKK